MMVQSAPGMGSAVPVASTTARMVPMRASATSTGTAAVVSVSSGAALWQAVTVRARSTVAGIASA